MKYKYIGNLIPKMTLLSQKEPLRELNFKRYGKEMAADAAELLRIFNF